MSLIIFGMRWVNNFLFWKFEENIVLGLIGIFYKLDFYMYERLNNKIELML